MKKPAFSSLWISLVTYSIVTITISSFTVTWLIMFARRRGIIVFEGRSPLFPLITFLITGFFVGSIITFVVGKRIIKPLFKLSEAIREVARGNFSITLDETEGVEQIRETTHDFNLMVNELGGIETLRNDFVTNVSHEFKTPLASIEGYAALLQSSFLTEEDRLEYTSLIIESTKKLSALTTNILRLSKLENQEIVPVSKSFSLDEQLRRALLTLEPQWSQKELELDIDMDSVTFFGSEELLLQVWLNLLGNAIKFTPNGKKISVNLKKLNDEVEVKIADEGIGIPQSAIQHIFEKFYQADKTRYAEGNGLGLALVSRIVSLCSGTVSVTSEEGKGSCFTVRLKVVPQNT